MSKQTYRLPGCNTTTTDKDQYVYTWKSQCELIEKEFDLVLKAFDPAYLFQRKDLGSTINLPTWFVIKLNDILKGLEK